MHVVHYVGVGRSEESLFHALFTCDHAKAFCAARDYFKIKLSALHPQTWAKDHLDLLFVDPRTWATTILVMWATWSSHNKYMHDEIRYQPMKSMEHVDEYLTLLDIPAEVQAKSSELVERWKPRDTCQIKFYSDGAIDGAQGCAGAGMVSRDHIGSFIRSRSNKYEAFPGPFFIELLACRDQIIFAINSGFRDVVTKLGCQEAMKLRQSLNEQSMVFARYRQRSQTCRFCTPSLLHVWQKKIQHKPD